MTTYYFPCPALLIFLIGSLYSEEALDLFLKQREVQVSFTLQDGCIVFRGYSKACNLKFVVIPLVLLPLI
jgi:hypothetical protein